MDITHLWETCLQFEYDRETLVDSLAQWITDSGRNNIIDAACGTGFPALDLIKRGFQITCSDGSPHMLEKFRQNALRAGIAVEPHCVTWHNLRSRFFGEFDAVMCRGSSLIYAGTWDDDGSPDPSALEDALSNFYDCLQRGGLLYVDTTAHHSLATVDAPQSRTYPIRVVDGQTIRLSEIIYTDLSCRLRRWVSKLVVDDIQYEFCRYSHYLRHDELAILLEKVGFVGVKRYDIPGEHYDVFLAHKP